MDTLCVAVRAAILLRTALKRVTVPASGPFEDTRHADAARPKHVVLHFAVWKLRATQAWNTSQDGSWLIGRPSTPV